MTNEVGNTDAVVEVKTETPAITVPPVVVKMKIYMDATGNEIGREPMGRGRPPFGSEKDTEGNLIIHNATKEGDKLVAPRKSVVVVDKAITYYITLNADGTEKERHARGRGRPNKLFTLATEGQFAGHYTMTEGVAPVVTPETKVETPVVEETKVDGSPVAELNGTSQEQATVSENV